MLDFWNRMGCVWIQRAMLLLVVAALSLSASAEGATFAGFWKSNCTDAFGIQIKPGNDKLWSVSFCGPGGCFPPGQWMPNTTITTDPSYKVIDERTLEIKGTRYTKCSDDTNPKLDYSTMKDRPAPQITYADPAVGLPDYEKNPPFTNHDPRTIATIGEIIASAKPSLSGCVSGSVRVWKDWNVKIYSNICDKAVLKDLRTLVGGLAPALDQSHLSLWLVSLDVGKPPVLLVNHMDVTPTVTSPYPFLNLWRLRIDGDSYSVRHAGAFLNGRIRAVRPFGEQTGRQVVFVQHVSCMECEPTVYITPIDFEAEGDAKPYEFTYSERHDSFDATLEYELPGMGHTVDATVETRLLPPSSGGPHLLQFFHMLEKDQSDEWWTFTCRAYRCDYTLEKKTTTAEFLRLWGKGRKL